MSKYCIGRHSVKLPPEFELSLPLNLSLSRAFGGGEPVKMEVQILADQVPVSEFKPRVDARVAELMSYSTGTMDIVKESDRVADGLYRIRVNKVEDYYSSELHAYKSGVYLRLSAISRENKVSQVERNQIALASDIKHVSAGEERSSAFCVGNVAILGANLSESAIFQFRSKKRADILIELTIDAYALDDDVSLLERVNGSKSLFRFMSKRPRVIRQGERVIAGMKAKEWLSVAEVDGHTQYIFAVETYGRAKPSPNTPKIHLELRSGQYNSSGRQPNSLTDEDAIALWDEMVGSLFIRQ